MIADGRCRRPSDVDGREGALDSSDYLKQAQKNGAG